MLSRNRKAQSFVLAFLFSCVALAPAAAQEPGPESGDAVNSADAKPRAELRTYLIEYSAVQSLIPVIQTVFDGTKNLRVSADDRNNSLIAYADDAAHKELEDLIRTLDTPAAEQFQTQIFYMDEDQLKDSSAALRLMRGDVDVATTDGIMIVRGKKKSIEEMTELLEMLDNAKQNMRSVVKSSPPIQDVTIEVTWLTDSILEDEPKFDGPIAAMLHRRGFQNLSELGMLEISTVVGGEATASGAVMSGMIELIATVEHSDRDDRMLVDLRLVAELEKAPIQFSTKINIPINHWIVFGVSSSAGAQGNKAPRSVFLMRVKPQDSQELEK